MIVIHWWVLSILSSSVFLYLLQEMQQTMGILNPKQSLPELSEVFTKLFGGGGSGGGTVAKKTNKSKVVKKRV